MNDLYEHKAKKYKYKYLKLKKKIEYMGEGGVALGSLRSDLTSGLTSSLTSGLKYLTNPSTWKKPEWLKLKARRDRERDERFDANEAINNAEIERYKQIYINSLHRLP
jgi:hypothetical protein